LIVGSAELIERIRRNPMKRALRVDKMTLAALEAVLRLYSDPARLTQQLPTLRHLTRPPAEIEAQAQRLLSAVQAALRGKAGAEVVPVKSQIGSGSLPVDLIASHGIAVSVPGKRRNAAAAGIAAAFRALPAPVIGRISDGAFIMDLRCLEHEDEFVEQLRHLDPGNIKE
jgi:L-seryl-tRNA(Ser) seleniumtransferase